jgi:RNA polymerase sigma factor (sigma-70 family)
MQNPPKTGASENFEALIARIARGSDEAVWELLTRYSTNIQRVVRRSLPEEIRDKLDSTDIVQSVWKSLLRRPDKLQGIAEIEHFVAFLVGMARLKVFEVHRKFTKLAARDVRRETSLDDLMRHSDGHRMRRDPPDGRAATPSAIASARETWKRARDSDGERGRRIVELRLIGLTHSEIASRLSIGESSVRRILGSMLQSLTS